MKLKPKSLDDFLGENQDLSKKEFLENNLSPLLVVQKIKKKADPDLQFHTVDMSDMKSQTQEIKNPMESLEASAQEDLEIYELDTRSVKEGSSMITVGRATHTHLVLQASIISRLHAYFLVEGEDNWSIRDAGSKNGTTIGKIACDKEVPYNLKGGDIIEFGNKYQATFHTPQTMHREFFQ